MRPADLVVSGAPGLRCPLSCQGLAWRCCCLCSCFNFIALWLFSSRRTQHHEPQAAMTIAVCTSRPICRIPSKPQTVIWRSWQLVCAVLVSLLLVLLLAENSSLQQLPLRGQRLIAATLWQWTEESKTYYPQGPDSALWPEDARQVGTIQHHDMTAEPLQQRRLQATACNCTCIQPAAHHF